MILDQFGKPFDRQVMRGMREHQTASVSYLTREFENHPARGLTPARLQSIMVKAEQGDLADQLDLADDMEERDGHIFAELSKRKGVVAALEWDILPPEGAGAAEKSMAAEVKEWVQSMPDLEDILLGMMDGVLKGFSCHEMVWGLDQGQLLPHEITFRPQRWFTLAKDRTSINLRQPASQYGEPLRPFNWICHKHQARSGYTARSALARVLAWPYLFKNFSTRDLAEFLEIYGLPLRLGTYPAGASDPEKRALLRAVTEIGHNAAGIVPAGMKIDFQNAASGTDAPFMSFIRHMEAVESKVILGQTLTASEGEHGTQALGNVHNEVRMDIRNADARQIAGTFTRQVIHPMCLVNKAGADPRRLPRIQFDIGEPEDMAAFADELPKLAKAGLRISVDWVHEKLRIPKAVDGEAILQAPEPPAGPGADPETDPEEPPALPAPKATKKPEKDEKVKAALKGGGSADPRDPLDDVVDEAMGQWEPMLAPMVQPVLAELDAAIAAGESLEAFRARLPALIERIDGRPMAETLARAAFAARLAGEADLDLS